MVGHQARHRFFDQLRLKFDTIVGKHIFDLFDAPRVLQLLRSYQSNFYAAAFLEI
jgi:hypothetical protein